MEQGVVHEVIEALRQPVPAETRQLLAARWEELPEALRDRRQVVGRYMVHCAYTLGPSFCSFGCTHCYLPSNANRVPLPSFAEMEEQIAATRRMVGPGGALQITGGDVVDAYLEAGRPEELVAVIRAAVDAQLNPMLMTHGQRLLEQPEYLEELVVAGGLTKLSLHIDITQAGRPGFPIRELSSEVDLHPLRRDFAELVLAVRANTGRPLTAAHTVTVTEANLDSVAEIMRWLLSDRRHLTAFRTVSFQPEAPVGRTRFSEQPVTPEATWREICRGAGVELPRDALWFGHPDCSSMATLMALFPRSRRQSGGADSNGTGGGTGAAQRVLSLTTGDGDNRRLVEALLAAGSGFGDRRRSKWASLAGRLGVIARALPLLPAAWRELIERLRRERFGPGFFSAVATGRVAGLNVVMHNFMGAEELAAPRSEQVEERLAGCGFRGAVRRPAGPGEEGDRWEAVPMCAMNGSEREELYQIQIDAGR